MKEPNENAIKVLFITQEIAPYLPETEISTICRKLPQATQERGREIRTFMPKFSTVNERRNQLHEVIRLSGMNMIIEESDHPLIIKVASIQSARMQVYFIDNDDYFQNRHTMVDENGEEYEDNDERAVFYTRGVMETVKKLRWAPDIIHCHGWITALTPLYVKKAYNEDPFFKNSKVVYSIYGDEFKKPLSDTFHQKLRIDGVEDQHVEGLKNGNIDFTALTKLAIDYSDGIIQGSENINEDLKQYIAEKNVPFLDYCSQDYIEKYNDFYSVIASNQ
ncbi:glycogen synthase [Bacteroidia bacterium]|nr:glycogen synthase [Bacteroidia bacterium]